jgi:hypothetical protein
MRVAEWTQYDAVHDAEHGGIGADAESKGGNDGEGEAGLRAEAADGVPQVLEAAVTPGLTETSTFPLAVTAGGLDLAEVYATLVANAKKRGG